MDHIIAGRFETRGGADAVAILLAPYIAKDDICIFHNNAPGQHDATEIGGDENEDPGSAGAGRTSVDMALAGGLAGGALGAAGGPVIALAAAGVGAYIGSLGGAVNTLGDHATPPQLLERRPGGVMLSVRIADPLNESRVIATLQEQGAKNVERAKGTWVSGDWQDFNPVEAPNLV